MDATEQELGGPHVLVNNAARGSHTRPEELTLAEWNGVIAVTLTGYFLFARECGAPHARRRLGRDRQHRVDRRRQRHRPRELRL